MFLRQMSGTQETELNCESLVKESFASAYIALAKASHVGK
jgi:hypothetical protein